MIWRDARSLGAARPISSQARWIESTITPAESIRVPSQSKINKSNCLGMLQGIQKRSQIGGKRRFDRHALAGDRVVEDALRRVEEHALHPLFDKLYVEFEGPGGGGPRGRGAQ